MLLRTLALLFVAPVMGSAFGCGSGVDTHPVGPDATVDAPIGGDAVDGAPDALELTGHHYIIDKQIIPLNNTQARALGLDLNNDSTVDNQLGSVMATFAGQGFDSQGPNDTAVDRGAILMLVDLQTNGFTTTQATFTLLSGADPQPPACTGVGDTVCRHHLSGSGAFTVAATSAHDSPLTGDLTAGALLTDAVTTGRLQLQTALLTASPISLDLIGARVSATTVSATGITSGIIAGGVTQSDVATKLLPGWQQALDAQVQLDCGGSPPTCGCAAGSRGKTAQELFDTSPRDCSISLSEMQNNSLIQSLTAPDVEIAGQQAVSLGIGFTATSATFTP